ncbi:MAG: glycerol acyltransferase [Bacteroidales bacterium]|nr:glycerol acyltransferase [Bacteroidales bacterium]
MDLIRIDLDAIIRGRLGKSKARFLPRFATRLLERLVCQDELNAALEATYPAEGTAFADAIFRHFDIEIEVRGLEHIPDGGRYIFASNHPLGGLDGIGLIKVLGARYGDSGLRVMVNDMLMNVEPLRRVFLPINKFGAQGRKAVRLIGDALNSDQQIVMFPAGLVSRLGDDGSIADLEWQKSVVAKAIETKRDIIPVRFIGQNRKRFYRLARLRKKLGLKFNLEQTLLPAELVAARGSRFSIIFGTPVTWQELRDSGLSHSEAAQHLRSKVYSLS